MRFQYLIQRQSERGIFVVMTALMIIVIMGIVGLAIDVSRQLVVNAELQNSADACALGGVLELNGAADAPNRAAQTGRFIGGQKNFESFQKNTIAYATKDITFSLIRSEGYRDISETPDPKSIYIRCDARKNGIANFFMGILGFRYSNVTATATATLSPSKVTCMAPFRLLAKTPSDKKSFGFSPYEVADYLSSTDPRLSAIFELATQQGNTNTSDVADLLTGYGMCNVPTSEGTCIDKGVSQGFRDAWNTRFGVYGGKYKEDMISAVPDRTGKAYDYQNNLGGSAIRDYGIAASNWIPFSESNPWKSKGKYDVNQQYNKQYGVTNRRVVAIPVVDPKASCNGNAESRPIVGWACVLLLAPYDDPANSGFKAGSVYGNARIQFLGNADESYYCGTMGIPGGNGAIGPLVPALVE